jgi:hypothetical protein
MGGSNGDMDSTDQQQQQQDSDMQQQNTFGNFRTGMTPGASGTGMTPLPENLWQNANPGDWMYGWGNT